MYSPKTFSPPTKTQTIIVCDDAATMEMKVRTVKYFKDLRNTMLAELGHDY